MNYNHRPDVLISSIRIALLAGLFFVGSYYNIQAKAQPICDPDVVISTIETTLDDTTQANALAQVNAMRDYLRAYRSTCSSDQAADQTLYVLGAGNVNVRAEASTSATIIGTVSGGSAIQAYSEVTGSTVSGSTRWYRIDHNGRVGYIHSSLVSSRRPAPAVATSSTRSTLSIPASQPPAQPVQPPANNQRPANCTEAVAMGLTPQQAAQWSHLDRDKDGVACYGD